MPIPIVLGVVAGLAALYKIGKGIKQTSDAKKRAARNKKPNYDIQQEYFDNQTIAQNLAGQGFNSKTVDNFNQESERGLQATIDATLQAGGGPNSIQSALTNYNYGNLRFAASDAEKRTQNIASLYDRNKELANQKVMQWTIDKYEKFKDEAAAITQERAAGQQNINTGISEGVSVVAGLSGAGAYGGMLKTGGKKTTGILSGTSTSVNPATDKPFDYGFKTTGDTTSVNQFADYYGFLKEQEQQRNVANAVSTASGVPGGLTADQFAAIERIVSGKYNFKDEEAPAPF